MSNNIESAGERVGAQSHQEYSTDQRAGLETSGITDAVLFERIYSEKKKSVKAVHKVTEQEQQQPKPDWWDIVSRIDELEKSLGHSHGLSDLRSVGFEKGEINIVKELLPWFSGSKWYEELLLLIAQRVITMTMDAGQGLM